MNAAKAMWLPIFLAFSAIAASQTLPDEHAGHHAPDAKSAPAPADLQSNMTKIRALLATAEKAKTSAARDQALDQHLAAMREQLDALEGGSCGMDKMDKMDKMKGMGDTKPGEDKPGMKGGMAMGGDKMMMCHTMMETRVNLLAGLLGQMVRHEELARAKRH
ncbi:MAG: hypothetical protein ABI821_14425 [Pseudomonadota bacterium]